MSQFIIKHNNEEYDLREMTIDELILLKLDVEDKLIGIKNQITEAKATQMTTGLYADADWFHRVTVARTLTGRTVQKINSALSQKRRIEKQEMANSFGEKFIDTAKMLLERETFIHLMDMTRRELDG